MKKALLILSIFIFNLSFGQDRSIPEGGSAGQTITSIDGFNLGWTTPTVGTVTSVTGSGNIASSGGNTPNITFTGVLPIANGGSGSSTQSNWTLLGNAGTVAGTNFVGTTDSIDFVFKTKGVEKMRIKAATSGNVGIGTTSPTLAKLQVETNTTNQGIRSAITTTTGTNYALVGVANGATPTANIGIYGNATSGTSNYSMWLDATGSGANNYTLYAPGAAQNYFAGSVGIGTTAPTSLFSVGSTSQFQVNTLGNIVASGMTTAGVVHSAVTTGLLSSSLIVGADITNGTIDLTTKVTGILPIANGGTNSATQNWVDLTTSQLSIAGAKGFTSDIKANGLTVGKGKASVLTNTAIGVSALDSITTGDINTHIGYQSGFRNWVGIYNTGVGYRSLYSNKSDYNTGLGMGVLTNNTTGQQNTSVGMNSQVLCTTGSNNTSIGLGSLWNNLSGSSNVALGYYAGQYETASNSFYIHNNLGVTNLATGKTNSLMYGVFNATAASQTLAINAATTISTLAGTGSRTVVADANGLLSTAATTDVSSLSAIGSTPNANGATITGSVLNLQPASASFGGVVTTGTQTLAGTKTFTSSPTVQVAASAYVTIDNTNTSGNSSAIMKSGNGTTSGRFLYSSYIANETSPQEWRTGMYGTKFYNIYNNTLASSALIIDNANNNIGIGVAAPAAKVEVAGDIRMYGSANNKVTNNKILYRSTTDATVTEVTTDGAAGSGTTNRILVPINTTMSVVVNIAVKQSGSANSKQLLRQFLITNNGGVTTIEGAVTVLGTDVGSAALALVSTTITANDTDDAIKVEVTGIAATNLRYTAFVVSTECTY